MYAAKTLIHTKIEVLSPSRGFAAVANLNWHSVKLPSKCLSVPMDKCFSSSENPLFAVNLVNSDSWLPKLLKKVTVKDSALNQDIYATSSKAQGNIEEDWVGTFKSQKRVGGEMPAPWIWCKHCDHVFTSTAVNLPRPAADGPVNSHERVKCSGTLLLHAELLATDCFRERGNVFSYVLSAEPTRLQTHGHTDGPSQTQWVTRQLLLVFRNISTIGQQQLRVIKRLSS